LKRTLSFLFLGFETGTNDEIMSMVVSFGHDLNILTDKRTDKKQDFKWYRKDDIDIILLDMEGFLTAPSEIVRKIKAKNPSSQVLVVSFQKDYLEGIQCFRAGALDVLQYPINKSELRMALERAITFHFLFQRSDTLTDIMGLVNTFSDWRKFETEEALFGTIEGFLSSKVNSSGMVIIRTDGRTKMLQEDLSNFEVHYNAKMFHQFLVNGNVGELLYSMNIREIEKGNFPIIIKESNDQNYSFMNLGIYGQKRYIGIFDFMVSVGNEEFKNVLGHFSRFVQNAMAYLYKTKVQQQLVSLAHTDDVTGLFNQRKLAIDIEKCIQSYNTQGDPFSVLFMDVDRFKQVNDGHGHQTGSLLLVQLANELKKVLRETDLIYRYGGDEFVIIVPGAESTLANEIGNRILEKIKSKEFITFDGEQFHLSISIGVASFPEHARNKDDIIKMADFMMYQAKSEGRGRVCLASELIDNRTKEMFASENKNQTDPKAHSRKQ